MQIKKQAVSGLVRPKPYCECDQVYISCKGAERAKNMQVLWHPGAGIETVIIWLSA